MRRSYTTTWAGTAILALLCSSARSHEGHGEDGPPCSATENPVRITAPFAPGTVTVDGKYYDWESIEGQEFTLHQALGEDSGQPETYPQGDGKMTVKAAHDGQLMYFLLKLPGAYIYNPADHHFSVSAALMFAIGNDATLYNMGGCPQQPGSCSPESCRHHEVDLIHFEVEAAIPGRQYGRNVVDLLAGTGADRIGKLNDGYGFNPHCRAVDGSSVKGVPSGLSPNGTAENDWVGVWSHTAITTTYGLIPADSPFASAGDAGSFIFEFSRPLRTSDHLQQDVQFTIGNEHKMGLAVWYPVDGQGWHGAQHYIMSCDWAVLALAPAPVPVYGWSYAAGSQSISTTTASALSALAMLLSLAAVFVSIVVGWWVRANARQFSSIDNL